MEQCAINLDMPDLQLRAALLPCWPASSCWPSIHPLHPTRPDACSWNLPAGKGNYPYNTGLFDYK